MHIGKLITSLSVGRKLALIYFLDLTAVIFISGILIHEKYIAIDFANKEIVGNRYIAVVRQALLTIAPSGERAAVAETGDARQRRADLLAAGINDAETQYGSDFGSADLSREFAAALLIPAVNASDHVHAMAAFAAGHALLTRIGNQSNLILDPDLDSYYVMSLIVLRFPDLLEALSASSRLALEFQHLQGTARQQAQTHFLILDDRIDAIVTGIASDYREAFAASTPQLQISLRSSQTELVQTIQHFRRVSQTLVGLVPGVVDDAAFARSEANALLGIGAAWRAAGIEIDRLLRVRVDGFFTRMWWHLGTAAALLTIILNLVFFVARQIAVPIRHLARVADNVSRSGDYTLRADWDSADEIGRLVSGFNGMLSQLDMQRIAQQDLVAQASAAEAQRALMEAIPIPLMVTQIPRHQVLHANQAARAWLNGRTEDPWESGMDAASRGRFFQRLSDLGAVDEFEVRWSGGALPTWALVSARRIDYQGQAAILTTFTPINQIKHMESRLALWAGVFEASSESIVVMDAEGRIVTVNQAFCRSTGFEIHEIVGAHPQFLDSERNAQDLFASVRHTALVSGLWKGELWMQRKDRQSYPAWLVMNAVRDQYGELTHFIAISLDISERKASEERIHYLAHHDVLTGLPNRFLCGERLQWALQQARRNGAVVGVLFVDLDRFKNINDSLGHHVGDALLVSVAQRLSLAVREGDTVSRLGGDEFVVILNNATSAEEIRKIVEQRLLPVIQKPHDAQGVELYVSCSIGIALFPQDGVDSDSLMRHADSAMYQAKKVGRNNAQFFTPELALHVTQQLYLETDLRHALERAEFVLFYQPRINVSDGSLAGVECLIRWQHPNEGLLGPDRFIPLAEESGLIVPVGAWVLREAFRQHALWNDSGLGLIPVSVNLSALQLKEGHLLATLQQLLGEFPIDAAQFELELTESILMENVGATIATLEAIKALGFTLSIDDFGTGYSSLNYLYRFPIDKLKIDRSFIQNIHSAPHNLAVTKAIIGLGHTLGLTVVAEGVEHFSDVVVLQQAGCDELQGFHLGHPMPVQQFEQWLDVHRNSTDEQRRFSSDSVVLA